MHFLDLPWCKYCPISIFRPYPLTRTAPKCVTMGEASPYLPVQVLSLIIFHLLPAHSHFPVLIHFIDPFHFPNTPSHPQPSCYIIYSLHKIILCSHHMTIPSHCTVRQPFSCSLTHSHCCFTHAKPLICMSLLLSESHFSTPQASHL